MMWSRQTILSIEMPVIESYVSEMTNIEEIDREAEYDQVLAYYKSQLVSAKEEF